MTTFREIVAGFRWPEGAGTAELSTPPLLDVAPSLRRPAWTLETLNGNVHTERIETARHEVTGVLRFLDDPAAALAFFDARRGRPVTYFEQRPGRPEWIFPCILLDVDPSDPLAVGLEIDPARGNRGEYAARVRLRRTDGGTFAELVQPGAVA